MRKKDNRAILGKGNRTILEETEPSKNQRKHPSLHATHINKKRNKNKSFDNKKRLTESDLKKPSI